MMGYSRRVRFGDGRSGLPSVEFAREFVIRLESTSKQPAAGTAVTSGTQPTPEVTARPPLPGL